MAATALMVLTQGPNTAASGVAVVGTLSDGTVTVTNGDNTDITSWTIELVDVPPGSGLSTGTLATAASSTPSATFTPDTFGSYRLKLTVSDGTTPDVDVRVFSIPLPKRGLIQPPYQKFPDPLPLVGEGLPGAKPGEMNFGSQARGWMGDDNASRRLLHQVISVVDAMEEVPSLATATVDGYALTVDLKAYAEPIAVVYTTTTAYVVSSGFSTSADTTIFAHVNGVNPDANEATTHTQLGSSSEIFMHGAYDSANGIIWMARRSGAVGGVRPYTVSTGLFSGPTTVAGDLATSIDYGSGFLWYTNQSDLVRINPASPGTQTVFTGLSGTPQLWDVVYDGTTANYSDTQPRVWVADAALPGLQRAELATTSQDGAVTLTNTTPQSVAVGGGYVWTVSLDAGASSAATVYRIDPDAVSLDSSSADIDGTVDGNGGGKVYDLIYDAGTAHLYVVAQAATGEAVLIKVNPSTLAEVTNLELDASMLVAADGAIPRISIFKGDVWVTLMGDSGTSKVLRVEPTTMTLIQEIAPYKTLAYAAVGGAVDSVFGRTGPVLAVAGDYAASEVDNDSSVSGTHVSDALDTLSGIATGLFTIIGGLVPDDPTDDGKIPVGNGGAFSFLAGGATSEVVTWNGSAWASGTVVNASVSPTAAIAVTKLAIGSAGQYIRTNLAGTANEFVDVTLLSAPVDPTDDDKIAIGSGGDLAYSSATLSTTALALGSRNVTTTGYIGLGATLPTAGTIRLAHGSSVYGRSTGAANVLLLDYGVTTTDVLTMPGPVQVGSGTFGSTGDIRLPIGGVISANAVTCTMGTSNQFVVVAAGGIILNNATSSNSSITAAGAVSSSSGGYTTQMVGSSAGYIEMSAITGQTREVRVGNNPTASVTGATLIVHGQNCVGATSTGGDALVRPGTGTSAGGNAELQSAAGATGNRVRVNDTGVLIVPSSTGSVQIGAAASADFGSGVGVIGIDEATTDPTGNPMNGGILYVENSTGKLVFRGKSGTITEIASA